MKPFLLSSNDDLFIVEKPAGLPCLPEKGGLSPTLAEQLLEELPELASLPDFGFVHRLDNDTSGLVIVAKTREAYENLRQQFVEEKIEKEYLALVVGRPPAEGIITTPIAHHPRKKKKMIVLPEGRPAHTTFEIVKLFSHYALLRVHITTGARHQIRVHLASIGHPLAGDRLYQNPKKRHEDTLQLSRHFLHASRIAFLHPGTQEKIVVTSSLPPDLADALTQLHQTR